MFIMNDVQIFNNKEFGEIRVVIIDGTPWFVGKDIATILEYTNPQKAIRDHVEDEDQKLVQLTDIQQVNETLPPNMRSSQIKVINKSGVYSLILLSKMHKARRFKRWVTSEVLPSISETGSYSLPSVAKTEDEIIFEALSILKNRIEKEHKLRIEAEHKAMQLSSENEQLNEENAQLNEDNAYKHSIIQGLTEKIPLADMRQRINQIVRRASRDDFDHSYHYLYTEFEKKYHLDLGRRLYNRNIKGSRHSYMDYIEKELKMIPELYELACKLYEEDYNKLIEQWGRATLRARGGRRN